MHPRLLMEDGSECVVIVQHTLTTIVNVQVRVYCISHVEDEVAGNVCGCGR